MTPAAPLAPAPCAAAAFPVAPPVDAAAAEHAARAEAVARALGEDVARARLRYGALLGLLGRVERRAATGRGRPAAELRRRVGGLTAQVEEAHRRLVDLEEAFERRTRPRPPLPVVPPPRRRPAVVQPGLFEV